MSKPLALLVADMNQIMSQIAEAGGELSPEIEAFLDDVQGQIQVKADGYAFIMERLTTEAEFWKAKADSYAKVAKACSALKERLNDSIKGAMVALGTDTIEGEEVRFRLSRTKPRLVIDEDFLPPAFKMQVVTLVPDKDKILGELEMGAEVPGAKQEVSFALRKTINSKKGIK